MNKKTVYVPAAVFLLIIFAFLSACAPTTINITADGVQLPKHINRLSNPETEITATVSFVRQFIYTEGKESIAMPEYLPLGKTYWVDRSNTKSLLMAIHIHNPKKVEYQVWESHKFWYAESKWPTHVQRCFYQGSMSTKDYRVDLPLDDIVKASTCVQVKDPETGSIIMSFGDALYELKGGASRQARLPADK